VHMLDSSDDILPAALSYLGLDPNTTKEADLQKAADLMTKIRPSGAQISLLGIRQCARHPARYAWSWDFPATSSRRKTRCRGQERRRHRVCNPQGGSAIVVRQPRHSEDARNPTDALAFINYLQKPEGRREELELHLICERQSREPEGSSTRPCSTTRPSSRTRR